MKRFVFALGMAAMVTLMAGAQNSNFSTRQRGKEVSTTTATQPENLERRPVTDGRLTGNERDRDARPENGQPRPNNRQQGKVRPADNHNNGNPRPDASNQPAPRSGDPRPGGDYRNGFERPSRPAEPPRPGYAERPMEYRMVSDAVIREFRRVSFDSDRLVVARSFISAGGFITVAQAVDMSKAFVFSDDRLRFLELVYPNCVDRWRFYLAAATLTFDSDREELYRFIIGEQLRYDRYAVLYEAFRMSDNDLKSILRAIRKETFSSTRLLLAQAIVSSDWFTATQLAAIAKVFTFDSDRFEFLLWAYPYCYDPQNYSIAERTLTFASDRDKLYYSIRELY